MTVALTPAASQLLRATIRLHLTEVFDWQCCLYGEQDAVTELRERGLIECRRDRSNGRVWFRITDRGLESALTPEPASFRVTPQALRALRGVGE